MPERPAPGGSAAGQDAACAVLEVDRLTRRFGAVLANDAVSIDLAPGEIHALIGPNGAGKSTLVNQVAGLLRQDHGAIRLLGKDIGHLPPEVRARLGLARCFQVSSLIPEFTALQNAMLAVQCRTGGSFRFFLPAMRDRSLTDRALASIEKVGLGGRSDIRASELSHGERRKLEIAVALALEPVALLLDEPMAGMGPEGSKELTGFLDGLRRTAPILLVEHDMDAVFALADRVSVLVYGRIMASGRPDDIRADAAVRAVYLGQAGR